MILSALPMNVFGVSANPLAPRFVTAGQHQNNDQQQNVVIELSADAFRVPTTQVSLILELYAGRASFVGTPDIEPGSASNQLFIDHFDGTISWNVVGDNDRRAEIDIVFPNGIPLTQWGNVAISLPIEVNHNDVYISGAALVRGAWTDVPRTRLTRTLGDRYLTFAYGDPLNFTEVLRLGNITVNEGDFGNFTNNTWIRLEAPANYEWFLGTVGGTAPLYVRGTGWGWQGGEGNLSFTPHLGNEFVNHTNRHVLYIEVNANSIAPIAQQIARQFQIRNLVLVPTANNNSLGAVNVHVSRVPGLLGFNTATSVQRPTNDSLYRDTAANPSRAFRVDNLHVGNRVAEGLALEVIGDELPVLRSGYVNQHATFPTANLSFIGNGPERPERGLQTATIELRELAPGAWSNLLGDRIEFTFEQEGVEILGAAARAGRVNNRYNLFPGSNNAWIGGFITVGATNLPGNSGTWTQPVGSGGNVGDARIDVTPNRVTLLMPPMPGANAAEQANRRLSEIRRIEVQFFISVVAGFENANPGEDIYVTVSGRGADLLPAANRRIAVASVVDPVSVRLVNGPVELSTDLVGDTIANRPISDIEITIYEPHLLRRGTQLQLNISGTEANQNLGLHMYANRTAVVSGNGLVLGQGTMGGLGTSGVQQGSGISFQIIEVPEIDDNNGPVTILVRDVLVTGTLVPDVLYHVVLTGDAIAENVVVGGTGVTIGAGQFVARPYAAPAIRNVRPSDATGRPGASLVISTTDVFPGVVGAPLAFQTIAGANVGLVSLRAFANLIGSTADDIRPDYPTAGQHTILGRDVYGRNVQVTVASGSTNVTVVIDGITHQVTDLASWAGPATGVAAGNLPVVNIGGNVFLPFRAMANIFGYDVEMVTAFSVRFFS